MYKAIVFAACLAVARAGFLGGAPVATYAAAAPVAHYSSAPAVSSSYINQNYAGLHAAPVAAVHAAPVAAYHAAPVAAYHAAPAAAYHAAPVAAYHSAPVAAYHAAPVAAYHSAPVAVHAPAIGATQQSVIRSYGGNAAVSHYSKAVDSAFSSVRKYDTRITNDGLAVAPVAAYAHAAPLAYAHHAAPVATYAAHAPVIAKTAAVAYSPAAVVSHATFTGLGAHYAW